MNYGHYCYPLIVVVVVVADEVYVQQLCIKTVSPFDF